MIRGEANSISLDFDVFNNSGVFLLNFCDGTQFVMNVDSVCNDSVLFSFTLDCTIRKGWQNLTITQDGTTIHEDNFYVQ